MRWHIAFTNLIEQELLGNNIENELHFSVIYRCPIHGQFGVTMYREGGGGRGEEGVSEQHWCAIPEYCDLSKWSCVIYFVAEFSLPELM